MKWLIIIFLLVLCFSCKKENEKFAEQEVKGILLHNITKQPLPGQNIELYLTESWVDKNRRDAEFPNGMLVSSTNKYSTVTDTQGKFSFKFIPTHDWNFRVQVNNSEYISVLRYVVYTQAYGNPTYISQHLYDTVYAEKPGYIRFHVQNTGLTYSSDSLYLSTPGGLGYKSTGFLNGPGFIIYVREGYDYRWAGANVNAIVYDTLAAESVNKAFTKWLHMRSDTVAYVTDSINILPYSITDYQINY